MSKTLRFSPLSSGSPSARVITGDSSPVKYYDLALFKSLCLRQRLKGFLCSKRSVDAMGRRTRAEIGTLAPSARTTNQLLRHNRRVAAYHGRSTGLTYY